MVVVPVLAQTREVFGMVPTALETISGVALMLRESFGSFKRQPVRRSWGQVPQGRAEEAFERKEEEKRQPGESNSES
jgi:hypothetical protein